MKLRWKYFIVLLVASLVPMVAVTLISQQASKKLGRSISAKTQKALMETVRREIVSATENYAMITRRAKSSYEFALHALTREAGIILTLPVPELTKKYFAKEFEDPKTAPEDLAPSLVHMKILKDGHLLPKLISYNHPNFLVAPGVNRTDVRDDIARFTRLSPALKGIAGEMDDSLFWIYVSSESGVHINVKHQERRFIAAEDFIRHRPPPAKRVVWIFSPEAEKTKVRQCFNPCGCDRGTV